MSRPKMLDLYCGGGGAAMGYHRAGFDVVGVDLKPQPSYPFLFVQGDALDFLRRNGRWFDAVHASSPCQAHTTMSNRWRGAGGRADSHTNLVVETREAMEATGLPWVNENVPGARKFMRDPVTLHGGMFGLRVYRPRLFESNVPLLVVKASAPADPIGVYGKHHDGRRLFTRKDGTIQRCARTLEEGQRAMGIDWLAWPQLTEAIPPAYTEFLGAQLLRVVHHREAA